MLAITILALTEVVFLSTVVESSTLRCKQDDNQPWSYNGRDNALLLPIKFVNPFDPECSVISSHRHGSLGPSAWGENFPKCYGEHQSPIDIEFKKVDKDPQLKHLDMNNYEVTVGKAEIKNNGHTVMITPEDDVARTITVHGSTYKLAQLHFHWGSHYDAGTEHLFDSNAYALEAHFVHINDKGEIAVVGVLYQDAHTNNTGFKPISEALPQIRYEEDKTHLRSHINLKKLLPPRLPLRIYRYSGSLTTPGCNEGVTWSVARDIVRIGTRQLNELRSLYTVTREVDHAGCHLQDNYRPVQPMNGRKVTSST